MSGPETVPGPATWEVRQHYHCRACGWIGPTGHYPESPEHCPCCGAKPDGSDPWPDGTYNRPAHGWTCFHCGETFHHEIPARRHFGADALAEPACRIKGAKERGLVIALRAAEADLARYRAEDTDLHRQIAAMACDHGAALRREEEVGYARGLRDAAVEHDRRVAELLAANEREVTRRREAEQTAAAEAEAGRRLRLDFYALQQQYEAIVGELRQVRDRHGRALDALRLLFEAIDRAEATAPHAPAVQFLSDAKAHAIAVDAQENRAP